MHENQSEDCLLLDQMFFCKKKQKKNWVLSSSYLQSVKFLGNKNISLTKMLKSKGAGNARVM